MEPERLFTDFRRLSGVRSEFWKWPQYASMLKPSTQMKAKLTAQRSLTTRLPSDEPKPNEPRSLLRCYFTWIQYRSVPSSSQFCWANARSSQKSSPNEVVTRMSLNGSSRAQWELKHRDNRLKLFLWLSCGLRILQAESIRLNCYKLLDQNAYGV